MKDIPKKTPVIQFILDNYDKNYCREEVGVRDRIYRAVIQENPGETKIMQFALGFARFLEKKRISIKDYDILAGFCYQYSYATTLPVETPEDYDPKKRNPAEMDIVTEANKIIDYFKFTEGSKEKEETDIFVRGINNWLFKHWEGGHVIPYYEKLLKVGFGGLLKAGRQALAATEAPEKQNAIQAMLITNQAAIDHILRYYQLAASMVSVADTEEKKKNLQRITDCCCQIADKPPRNFFEAIQLLWLAQDLVQLESFACGVSLGRIDKYLYPFYKKDVESGILTYAEAAEIMDAFWLKFIAAIHSYQNITIGGEDENGNYIYNDITRMCLQSSRRFCLEQPQLSFRWSEKMPDEAWEEIFATIIAEAGFPSLFNDRVCIKNKMNLNVAKEDAYNYGVLGCVELAVPGKEYPRADTFRLNWAQIIELMLNNGESTVNGTSIPLKEQKDLSRIKTFEDFYAWYKGEFINFIDIGINFINRLAGIIAVYYPTPFLSVMMEGCYQKGKDITSGGTIYSTAPINVCGVASTADSLVAIKKAVFEDKIITLPELSEAVRKNFVGYEDLHDYVLHHCPKYGNDDDEVDIFAKELMDLCLEHAATKRTIYGDPYKVGMFTVQDHAVMGDFTGALPDGRLARASLSNGMASGHGREKFGPTAVINSVLKVRVGDATNGMVLDLKFIPAFFDKKNHIEALKSLIISYFMRGGLQLQFNVVDRKTLIDAQKHPEKYPNLVVRVSGFSALFTNLPKVTQDDVIARTEFGNI